MSSQSSSLPTRPLGRTGMEITTVGLGCWAMGGPWFFGWGEQDDEASVATILHAVELGVNWLDTAPAYGLGHSEEIVARALRTLPEADRPLVFTKCGLVWDEAHRDEPPARTPRPDSIRWEVERSLSQLNVERIDLLPTALATRGRHSPRGLLAGTARSPTGRQDPRCSPVQPRCRSAGAGGAAGSRGQPPAAVLGDPTRRGPGYPSLVPRPRDERHRLRSHVPRPALRVVLPRAVRGPSG